MYIRLNENEIINAVCVVAAQHFCCGYDEIDVKEINSYDDGNIVAHAHKIGRMFSGHDFDLEDICEGISIFLEEFHHCLPESTVIQGVNYNPNDGFWAEVTVGE